MDFYFKNKEQFDLLLKDENNVKFFCDFAKKYMRQDAELVKEMLDVALPFTKENNLHKANAWLNNYYSWICFDMCKYKEAIERALEAYNVLEKYNDKRGMSILCNCLMSCYSQVGQIELSNEWGIKGVEIAEEIHDDELLHVLMLNIGIGYIQLENYNKAMDILKYLEVSEFEFSTEIKISLLQSMAEIEIYTGNTDKALEYISKVYHILNTINSEFFISETKKIEGMAYCKLKDYDKAKELYTEAYNYAKLHNQSYEYCNVLIKHSDMCGELNRIDEQVCMLEELISSAEKYDYYGIIREACRKLYKIHKSAGKLNSALLYLEQYDAINEKVYNLQNSHWMAKLDASQSEREAELYKILYDKTELLSSIGKEIISTLDENNILKIINKEIHKLMKTDMFSISIYDEESETLLFKYIDENNSDLIKTKGPIKLEVGNYLSQYCIINREDMLIKNAKKEIVNYINIDKPDEYPDEINFLSILYTPMIIKERIIGVITVQAKDENVYSKNDMNTLKVLGNYVAIALENATSYKNMENVAIYDSLTGIFSRREILEIADAAYKRYESIGERLTVAMIDIDKFKTVNDKYGHTSGDKILMEIAETISKNIRETDYVGRYGGDEFLLIYSNTKADKAKAIAERIRNLVYDRLYAIDDNQKMKVSISTGLYEFDDKEDLMSGIRRADRALYEAKRISRNHVVVYNEIKN